MKKTLLTIIIILIWTSIASASYKITYRQQYRHHRTPIRDRLATITVYNVAYGEGHVRYQLTKDSKWSYISSIYIHVEAL